MTRLSARAAALQTTIDLYPDLFATSAGTINLGPGDPQFGLPEAGRLGVVRALEAGHTSYTAANGLAELRQAIAKSLADQHGRHYDRDCITVTNGSKQALANSILATVEPGDEVVLIAPYYSVYRQMVLLAGGIPVVVGSDPASGFALPVAEISRALSPRTRWILLNSPCNPTGRVTTADELRALWSCIAAHPDVGVLSDQVYELLTFDGRIAPCMASICPEAAERTVLISGYSKSFNMTGLRIGYAATNATLARALTRLQFVTTSCASSLGQYAALAILAGDASDYLARSRRMLKALTDRTAAAVTAGSSLRPLAPHAGLYLFADCGDYLGAADTAGRPVTTDLDLVRYLSDVAQVLVMPGTLFGTPGWLRITCAVDERTLDEGVARILGALGRLTPPSSVTSSSVTSSSVISSSVTSSGAT
jgi:aspartate aminotransferase